MVAFSSVQQRGEDLESTIELALHDAFEGGKKAVTLQVEDLCPRCHGTGTDRNRICTQCHGTGRVRETKKFDVTIPRGVRDGQRIRLGFEAPRDVHIRRSELADEPVVVPAAPRQQKEPSHAFGHPPSGG